MAASSLGLAAPADSWSAEELPSEQAYFSDFPVVLSATRLTQNLTESPLPVSVIDRAMIEASGARDIEELFRLAPGMIVGYHDGHTGFATYHAIADRYARRMQILIDGRSVYTPTFGGVDWSSLPLAIENIQRIEIIRAPNAATHGANALLGTISIITRDPVKTEQAITNTTLAAGNNGIYKVFASHADTIDTVNYRLTASRWGDDGFEQPPGYADDRDITLFNVQVNWQATPVTR
ncbi:MAG TPA: TonB-dependent receptor plug domain-containing protein, partial [Gammaproteobacteria bacterium]|nr:TonB-dependent receptor plug domain-containing protein [Gammaproteobacteria bacterium]